MQKCENTRAVVIYIILIPSFVCLFICIYKWMYYHMQLFCYSHAAVNNNIRFVVVSENGNEM